MAKNYGDFILKKAVEVLAVDSPTGYTHHGAAWVMNAFKELGYEPQMTVKGGVIVDLGGKNKDNGILLEAHLDTLGGMVAEVKGNGRLRYLRRSWLRR